MRAPNRAVTQAGWDTSIPREMRNRKNQTPAGTIEWCEHERAWEKYSAQYGRGQSAQRIHERGGFSYGELIMFLGHKPTTWRPR